MTDLPNGWAQAPLAELAGSSGVVTDGDWVESKDQDPSGGVRLIQLADIGDGEFLDRSARFMNAQAAERLNCTYLELGDLLIARMPDPLGRACIFPGVGKPAVTAVDVFIWRPDANGADARWLMYSINSPEVRGAILGQAGGTTRQRIAGGKLKGHVLPVPPIAEQRRIVAKLDGLLGRTARARKELDRVPNLVAHYKQTILTAAFTGTLTQDWRADRQFPDVTPNEILDKLQSERDAKRVAMGIGPKGKNRSLPGRSVHLPDLDTNWVWVTFDDCAWDLTVGHVGPMKDRYVTQGTPFLRSLNVKPNKLDTKKVVYIDERFERELAKSRLSAGDLVVVRTGEPGVAAVVPRALDGANCSDLVIGRLVGSLDAHYAAYYMNSEFARDVVRGFQVGVAQQHFNVGAMSVMPLPYAPKLEQQEIVRRIESAFTWLDKLAAEHTRAAALLPKLEQALLGKAFRGELVPQDPNDEPASALLERIRAARAEAPERKRKSRSSDLPRAPRQRAAMTKSRLDQDVMHQPYLAKHLRDAGGSAKVEDLFRSADLPVTDFYKQLAWEVEAGHVNDQGALLEAA